MIRKFKVYNQKYNENLGTLYYNTETEEFKMRMLDSYEGLHPCIFMQELGVKRGLKWIEGRNAENYISLRIFPSNRQGLGICLASIGLTEYSIIGILDKTHGASEMDDNIFIEITDSSEQA